MATDVDMTTGSTTAAETTVNDRSDSQASVVPQTGPVGAEASAVPYGRWSESESESATAPREPPRLIVDESALFADPGKLAAQMVWTRHLMLGLLLSAVLLHRGLVVDRTMFAGLLAVELGPIGVLLHAAVHRHRRLPAYTLWPDAVAAVVAVALAPTLFRPVLILALAQLTVGAVACGTFAALLASSVLVVGYPAIAIMKGVESPLDATFFVLLAFLPGMALLAGRVRALERVTRRRYLDLLSGLDAVVWEADPQTLELLFVSPQVLPMFGYEPAGFRSKWIELIPDEDRSQVLASRQGALQLGEDSFSLEHRMVKRSGDVIFVRNTFAVERRDDGSPRRVRGVIVDVTLQQEAEATIRKQSQYDTLTGLPNRALFSEQLRRRIDDARRTGEHLAVLVLDLNGFKEVNDTLGHGVGDQLLQAIAGRLASYLPERSLVARLGGDEFAVMVYPANPRSAAAVAETIASCLQPPITIDAMTVQAAASTGIAIYPTDGDSLATLMRRADAAMYEAKKSGRTHVFAAPDDNDANTRRHQLLGELRGSITGGDLRLFHQPKIDLRTGHVVGTEGLVRWSHRQFGLLAPHEFIELSELSGLIQPLTRWVIERAIRDLAGWRSMGFDFTVAVNLSVRNFFDQGLPTFIARLLSEHSVPGDQLVLEITEREVMADRALARSALSAFRSLGVKISIDDFGTGFSSLAQLQQLPIDEIKVDQSFVSGMLASSQDEVIVRSIIEIGHNLGLDVVAEGAEEREQILRLRELGADRAQGFAVSAAMSSEDFSRWLVLRKRTPPDASGRVHLLADESLFDEGKAPPFAPAALVSASASIAQFVVSPTSLASGASAPAGPFRTLRRPGTPAAPVTTSELVPVPQMANAMAGPAMPAPSSPPRFVLGPDVRFANTSDLPAAPTGTTHPEVQVQGEVEVHPEVQVQVAVAEIPDHLEVAPPPEASAGFFQLPVEAAPSDLPSDWRLLLHNS